MKSQLIASALVLLFTSCGPTPTVVPPSPTLNTNNPTTLPATAVPQEIIPATPTALSANTSAGLWLQVLAPLDEAVVNALQVDVIGAAPVGTVISVNDEILIVGADQQFRTTVLLEEGPNLIEILASDENGNEASALLTITYEP
jgi:hypothetical protein